MIKTKYLEFISESRYKTHGIFSVKRTLPKVLDFMNCKYNIDFNYNTNDFQIYFTKITDTSKEVLISRCELLGYFPSVFIIDGIKQIPKNNNSIDDFVEFVKNYKLPTNYNEIYFQFESWLDEKIETPKTLYHVCRTIDVDKIKKYGISPKSKHKISYHPDRIYFVIDLEDAISIIKQFKEKEKIDYSIIKIEFDNEDLKDYKLLVRKDPNFNNGYYTTQNVLPGWITKIENYKK